MSDDFLNPLAMRQENNDDVRLPLAQNGGEPRRAPFVAAKVRLGEHDRLVAPFLELPDLARRAALDAAARADFPVDHRDSANILHFTGSVKILAIRVNIR